VPSAFWMLCPVLAALQECGDANIHCTDVLVDITLLSDSESLGFPKLIATENKKVKQIR